MTADYNSVPSLVDLVEIFYQDPSVLGSFKACDGASLPSDYRTLLAHNHHMTVTVERFYGSPVDVDVLEVTEDAGTYSRRILLRRQTDRTVVQFGIAAVRLEFLSPAVVSEIRKQATPLGRILINHNVLRDVELFRIWRVTCGPDLCRLFSVPAGSITFGRTARILCNGEPAIRLLEIVAPI
jgi:chorismate-pyruvate lyase